MARRLSLIDNKVARRISVSFVAAALIPIVIFGYLSFQEVSGQLRDQTAKSLHRSGKDYAIRLIARLTLFESALHLVAYKVRESGNGFRLAPNDPDHSLVAQFANLAVITANGDKHQLSGETGLIPSLSEQETQDLSSGRTLIKTVTGLESGDSQVWMATNLIENHPEAGILMAALKPELLWEAENIEPNELWVLGKANQLLFASEQGFDLPAEAKQQFLDSNSGQFAWKNKAEKYIGVYRKLPMKTLFAATEMVIVQAQPEALAFAAIQQFGEIYPPAIALAVLIVAFFITRLVIKYLSPLDQLKAATLKIAGGDFDGHVNINSKDEFEALADSFNDMTRRLRSQFNILATMAEIDRHILSSLNAEDIIETALSRLPSILYCDLISIAKIDPETYFVSDIHTRHSGKATETTVGPIKLNLHDVLDLLAKQNQLVVPGISGKLAAYLQTFGNPSSWKYMIIPVVINGTLASIICLGYQASNDIPPDAETAARNFGDRLAVALSNAAWEEKLYQQAHYDSLTGLPNRLVLNDRLGQELARARRDNTQIAVCFIDLDRFKTVNDSLGHAAGDELLTQVSRIFVECVRETDLVVRLGGDEFVVVISDLHDHLNSTAMVSAVAEKILAALNHTLVVAGHAMTFTASLGIAVFPQDADNAQDLLKNADTAMYHAKDEGRANFRFYSPELNAFALENIKLEQELRGALAKLQLRVYYQPKVDLNRRIIGAEALIRWQHAKMGLILPAKFIPLAEQTGLIVDIGHWVLEQVCYGFKACHDKGLSPVPVSVNLSGIEFKRPDLVDKIAGILSKTGVNPKFIELELTESVVIGNTKVAIQRMHDLKSLGLKLSMDDFGTGFSSLSYLKEMPLDVLKIDQSFVRNLGSEESSRAIVKSIFALAHGLGMDTVAEGVETDAQFEFLKQQQCQKFQGFLFSRPIPAEDFFNKMEKGVC